MDQPYKDMADDCGLFGEGICEFCGKHGYHAACEERGLKWSGSFIRTRPCYFSSMLYTSTVIGPSKKAGWRAGWRDTGCFPRLGRYTVDNNAASAASLRIMMPDLA
ncbi:hypothetical protein RBA41_19845 [Massilia sp. CCM 9210]|uniref:hypothetical protein n=1 Tax=Massilia scottii TaxID=3057166 RepID=UPI00279676C1|nr:hypothetical protein [Massilia sp. CCM 9210]MDQ1815557.1 hypothetical protein [Massilia sp. CCM 9210]